MRPLASAPFAAVAALAPLDTVAAHSALAETVRLLLAAHPAGAKKKATDNKTPLDLAKDPAVVAALQVAVPKAAAA